MAHMVTTKSKAGNGRKLTSIFMDRCDEGCGMFDTQSFSCITHGCSKESLCIGCAFECADCKATFCESHIVDLKDETENTRFSEYICAACLATRRVGKVAA